MTLLIIHLQEEQSHLLHLMSSSDRVVRESTVKSVCVQTDDSPLQSVAKLHDNKNDEILTKVSAAVDAMQRNVVELEKQIATLNELHNKKVFVLIMIFSICMKLINLLFSRDFDRLWSLHRLHCALSYSLECLFTFIWFWIKVQLGSLVLMLIINIINILLFLILI